MDNKQLFRTGFVHGLGVAVYVALVALLIKWLDNITPPGQPDSFFAPMFALMLLVLSVTIVGSLVFLRPVMAYLDGQKRDAVRMLMFTITWLFLFTVIGLFLISIK